MTVLGFHTLNMEIRALAAGFALLISLVGLAACIDEGAGMPDESVEDETIHDREHLERKAIANLKKASSHIVEEGIQVYHEVGGENRAASAIAEKLQGEWVFDPWVVQLWVDPWVNSPRYLAHFRIRAMGIYVTVQCVFRSDMGKIYEYWVIQLSGRDWAGIENDTIFMVARTSEPYGKREIIHRSDTFFETYQIDDEHILALPVEDMRIIYDLDPTMFPKSYRGSRIANMEVVINRKGEYVLRKRWRAYMPFSR